MFNMFSEHFLALAGVLGIQHMSWAYLLTPLADHPFINMESSPHPPVDSQAPFGCIPDALPVWLTIVGCFSPDDSFDYDKYMQNSESNVSSVWWRMSMAMNNIAVNGGFCDWTTGPATRNFATAER